MSVRTNHQISDSTWFITFTCFNWMPLFETTQSCHLIYNWFKLIDEKHQIKTLAFVIMPNHVYLLLELTDKKVNLNTIIGNAKRLMAYGIVDRLKKQGNISTLNKLQRHVLKRRKQKGSCIKYLNHHLMPGLFIRSIF